MPNPLKDNISTNGPVNVRNQYIKYANMYLEQFCNENSISFFNIYNLVSDENGYLKSIYTVDNIHLDYNNKFLRKTIDDRLNSLVDNSL